MTKYNFYVVENSFVARVNQKTKKAERLMPDRKWENYPDVWDVCTNGRSVKNEQEALKEAKEIFELRGVEHQIPKRLKKTRYAYYRVEGYVVRIHAKGAEYIRPDGKWEDYPNYMWDVAMNGRLIGNKEEEALKVAKEIFEGPLKGWWDKEWKKWWEQHRK